MLSMISVGAANLLILMRVVILWDRRPVSHLSLTCCGTCLIISQVILKLLGVGFGVSFVAQLAVMLFCMIRLTRTWRFLQSGLSD